MHILVGLIYQEQAHSNLLNPLGENQIAQCRQFFRKEPSDRHYEQKAQGIQNQINDKLLKVDHYI